MLQLRLVPLVQSWKRRRDHLLRLRQVDITGTNTNRSYNQQTVRRPMLSPSGPSSIPIAMPAPRSAEAQAQTVGLGTGQSPRLQMEYLNPNMIPSSGSPSRSPARSPSTSIASSVGFHQIVVEPPVSVSFLSFVSCILNIFSTVSSRVLAVE